MRWALMFALGVCVAIAGGVVYVMSVFAPLGH